MNRKEDINTLWAELGKVQQQLDMAAGAVQLYRQKKAEVYQQIQAYKQKTGEKKNASD